MARVHVSVPNDQELSEDEQQTLLNGPVAERLDLPDDHVMLYGVHDQQITKDQSDAIADAWQARKITGFGVGQ